MIVQGRQEYICREVVAMGSSEITPSNMEGSWIWAWTVIALVPSWGKVSVLLDIKKISMDVA